MKKYSAYKWFFLVVLIWYLNLIEIAYAAQGTAGILLFNIAKLENKIDEDHELAVLATGNRTQIENAISEGVLVKETVSVKIISTQDPEFSFENLSKNQFSALPKFKESSCNLKAYLLKVRQTHFKEGERQPTIEAAVRDELRKEAFRCFNQPDVVRGFIPDQLKVTSGQFCAVPVDSVVRRVMSKDQAEEVVDEFQGVGVSHNDFLDGEHLKKNITFFRDQWRGKFQIFLKNLEYDSLVPVSIFNVWFPLEAEPTQNTLILSTSKPGDVHPYVAARRNSPYTLDPEHEPKAFKINHSIEELALKGLFQAAGSKNLKNVVHGDWIAFEEPDLLGTGIVFDSTKAHHLAAEVLVPAVKRKDVRTSVEIRLVVVPCEQKS